MKTKMQRFTVRASVVAVQGALLTFAVLPVAAYAQDATVEDLAKPTNTVEVGVGDVGKKNFKFGEYNGLDKKGGYVVGDVDIRGGGTYDSEDATRARITGTDLGLDTRNLSAEYGQQGRFRINVGYDELLKTGVAGDSYRTPYQGAGSSTLTLPSSWITPVQLNVNTNANPNYPTGINFRLLDPAVVNNDIVYRSNNAANNGALAPYAPNTAGTVKINGVTTAINTLATMQNTAAVDSALFNNVDLSTKRKKLDGGFSFEIDPRWEIQASASQEKKTGLRAQGAVDFNENSYNIIPNLIDQTTNQVNLKLNYSGEKGFAQGAYYGSIFKQNNPYMTIASPVYAGAVLQGTANQTVGPFSGAASNGVAQFYNVTNAPSNQFHQFNFTGGYNFDKNTKLVANAAYSRNTQNESFLGGGAAAATNDAATLALNMLPFGTSATSLNGLVVTKSLNLKLTAKPVDDLKLAAGYKYNDRDNRTPVNTYLFYDIGETGETNGTSVFQQQLRNVGLIPAAGVYGAQGNILSNRPYSRKDNQFNFDADYALAKGQAVKGAWEYQKIDRWCNGDWTTLCADATNSKENTLKLEYRANSDTLSGRIGYDHGVRKVDYNENAFLAMVPMANVVATNGPAVAGGQSFYAYMVANGLNGFGPLANYAATAGNANLYFPGNNVAAAAYYGNPHNIISELPGMERYNEANRNRNKIRSLLTWQADEKLNLTAGLDYTDDKYPNSTYGLQSQKATVWNFDGAYSVNDDFSVNAYYSREDSKQLSANDTYGSNAAANSSAVTGTVPLGTVGSINTCTGAADYGTYVTGQKMDTCLDWSTQQKDVVNTIGIGFKHKGLMSGKLEMTGDAVYSGAKTSVSFPTGGAYLSTLLTVANFGAAAATTWTKQFVSLASMPDVTTNVLTLKLGGKYQVDKTSAVRVNYIWQRMKTTDWAYDSMQPANTATGLMPTYQQAPNYTAQAISVSYIYSFK